MLSWGLSKSIEIKLLPKYFISYKALLKTESCLELVSLPYFLHNFEEKYFSYYIQLTDQMLFYGFLYLVKYRAICVF